MTILNKEKKEKFHKELKRLRKDKLFELIDQILLQLPKTRVNNAFKGYIESKILEEILLNTPDKATKKRKPPKKKSAKSAKGQSELFLKEIELFHKESFDGDYYEYFNVNSSNFTDTTEGTALWISKCEEYFKQCISEASQYPPETLSKILTLLIDLLLRIDEGYDDIIFFADEGGSWQVLVDWKKILPLWFSVFSKTATVEQYAAKTKTVIENFAYNDKERKKYFSSARRKATAEQRKLMA
ncbi:MAG: hypothetical protein KAI22_09870 [Gammaproteobacteria bacterium]|nr:hypothetical protein [Gammaproteobacteria bacterium]